MLRIGEFSKLARVSIRMLRYYDEMGLLVPEMIDELTGYRYYSEAQLPLVNRMMALKEMGFSLGTIKEILTTYTDLEALRHYLMIRRTELYEEAEQTKARLMQIESMINHLGKGDLMKYDVTLKTLPERSVASVRSIIPSYECEGELWQILRNETEGLKLQADTPCYSLAIFHDREYKEKEVDVEVQRSVKGSYENTKNVVFKTVPALQMASAIYKGPYGQISEVNLAVANWIQENGYEMNGLSFCIYHVSPGDTNDPEQLVTEVCYPVKKK